MLAPPPAAPAPAPAPAACAAPNNCKLKEGARDGAGNLAKPRSFGLAPPPASACACALLIIFSVRFSAVPLEGPLEALDNARALWCNDEGEIPPPPAPPPPPPSRSAAKSPIPPSSLTKLSLFEPAADPSGSGN